MNQTKGKYYSTRTNANHANQREPQNHGNIQPFHWFSCNAHQYLPATISGHPKLLLKPREPLLKSFEAYNSPREPIFSQREPILGQREPLLKANKAYFRPREPLLS